MIVKAFRAPDHASGWNEDDIINPQVVASFHPEELSRIYKEHGIVLSSGQGGKAKKCTFCLTLLELNAMKSETNKIMTSKKHKMYRYGILILTLVSFSCGTTHHFMPPQRLDHKDFEAIVSLSYDLNKFHLFPWPDLQMNFYYGIGKDYAVGFGYQPPFFLSHLSGLKYIHKNKSKSDFIYGSCSRLFTANHSALIEVGANHINRNGRTYHTFSSGLWIDLNRSWDRATETYRSRPVIRPFIRYMFSHKDLRAELQNHIGLTRNKLINYRNVLRQFDPLYIPYAIIDTIEWYENWRVSGYLIKTIRNHAYMITKEPPLRSQGQYYRQAMMNAYKLGDEFYTYYVVRIRVGEKGYDVGSYTIDWENWPVAGPIKYVEEDWHVLGGYEIDMDKLLDDYKNKNDIFIENYPRNDTLIYKKVRWYIDDWSFGIGVGSRERW